MPMKTMIVNQTFSRKYNMGEAPTIRAPKYVYIVRQVKNSVSPCVGDTLSKDELHGFCENEAWDVTIKME